MTHNHKQFLTVVFMKIVENYFTTFAECEMTTIDAEGEAYQATKEIINHIVDIERRYKAKTE